MKQCKLLQDLNFSEAIKKEFSLSQEYVSLLKKYKIKKIRVYENEVVGPAIGMIYLIEDLFKFSLYSKVADIFSGSLGYSQVCSKLGVSRVDAYDLQIKNYYPENHNLYVYKKDLLTMSGKAFSNYDLVIVEPPRKYHLLILNTLPQCLKNSVMLFRIGSTNYVDHIEDCKKICKSKYSKKKWNFINLYDEIYIKMEN